MDKYDEAFKNAGSVTFDRFRFDEPDIDMLIINDEQDFMEHLRVQGAGMAYYTALYKQCERQYDEYERKYKYRCGEMYADCSELLLKGGKKGNIKDVEAFMNTKYSSEIAKMESMLDELRKQRDNVFAFLEGWKQKSYILSNMKEMVTAGLFVPRDTITEGDMQEKKEEIEQKRNVREILKKRRENKEESSKQS